MPRSCATCSTRWPTSCGSSPAAGLAHGDLSPYNLLVHHGRVVAIDLPQVVDLVSNPQGFDLLHRDCVNVCDWFTRQRLECDAEELFGELVGEVGF